MTTKLENTTVNISSSTANSDYTHSVAKLNDRFALRVKG